MHQDDAPRPFKIANETLRKIAALFAGDQDLPGSHRTAMRIMESAMGQGDKREAMELLAALTSAERKEVAAFFSLLQQFSHQVMQVCTSAAVKHGDEYVTKHDDQTGTMNLSDDPTLKSDESTFDATSDDDNPNLPPEIKMLAALAKAILGDSVEMQVVDGAEMDEMFNGGGVRRLQDDYGDIESDPIKQIAKKLSRMPGSKQPRLPHKKLPEA